MAQRKTPVTFGEVTGRRHQSVRLPTLCKSSDEGDYGVCTAMNQEKTVKNLCPHIIQDGEIYTTQDLMALFRVTKKTVAFWFRLGLEGVGMSRHPKARKIVFGEKLKEFLKSYGMALKMVPLLMEEIDGKKEIEEET
jgi:hypothetical protein